MKISKFLLSIVLVLILFTGIACGTNGDNDNTSNTNIAEVSDEAVNTVNEPAKHYQNTLHKVNVIDSDAEFVKNGKTEYQIVIPAKGSVDTITDELIVEATEFLVNMVQKKTYAKIQIVRNENLVWDGNRKWIVVGCDDLFEQANLTMPKEINNDSGYYIKTVGSSVFIKTFHCFGYQFGVISFLKNVLGYDYISNDMVVFSKDGSTMPEMEIIEQSDYAYKFLGDMTTNEAFYGMGFTLHGNIICNTDGVSSHNMFKLLPPSKFYAIHPEWYSQDKEQVCFTAGGDKESFNEMVAETAKNCVYWLSKNERSIAIPLVMQDGPFWCRCEECQSEKEKYGTDSAVYVKFANEVSKKINEYLAIEAENNNKPMRDVRVLITPYSMAEVPPVKEENGKYVPIDDSVVLGDNVFAYIAPAYASYTRSFYDSYNEPVRKIFEGWRALSNSKNELFAWLYETNYFGYLYPFNSYEASIETFRYCYEQGTVFMYSTSQYNNFGVTGFSRFKDYIDARSLFDLNLTFDEIADDFFPAYFGDASEIMRTFFDEMQLHLKYIDDEYSDLFDGQIFAQLERPVLWPKKVLERWIGLTEEAYKKIEHYKNTDLELYNVLKGHIKQESISPRFMLLRLYEGYFTDEEIKEFVKELKSDCAEMSIYMYTEAKSLDEYFSGFGV